MARVGGSVAGLPIPKLKFLPVCWTVLLCLSLCTMAVTAESDKSSSEEKDKPAIVPPNPMAPMEQNMMQNVPMQTVAKPAGPVNKEGLIADDTHGHYLDEKSMIDMGFIHAFVASLSVIIVSELGDKTFFIAAIMAMRHSRVTVFCGALAALGFMTVLSAILGYATTVIPRWLTYYVSSALFAIFGIKMLKEGYTMSAEEGQEELEEVQADLRKKDEEYTSQGTTDVETGIIRTPHRRFLYALFSRIFLQSFTLTFLAEWGDRSQIATIILAARDEVIGVIIGGTLGHALCTGLAVMGGRFIAQRISIRTVTLIGGVVFIIFAVSAFFIDPDE